MVKLNGLALQALLLPAYDASAGWSPYERERAGRQHARTAPPGESLCEVRSERHVLRERVGILSETLNNRRRRGSGRGAKTSCLIWPTRCTIVRCRVSLVFDVC